MQSSEILRTEVKFRFIDYLKAAQIPYYEPSLTVCPHCGQHAQVVGDFLWNCPNCGSKGDVVDYAMESHGFRKTADALKHVCRVLGVKICSLDTIAADELMDMQFPDNPELIEGLLGKGLYLLAGASKIGKSWLVLWLAHCVSLGLPVWGLKTRQCGVLYLSLEDTDQRLQRRLVEVTGGETGDLTIATDAELLGSGLEEQLTNFLSDHPETKFVIIDTLQKIRQLKADSYSYAGDYATLTVLKQIADRFDLTILLVHHTRKQEAYDAVDKISGTTGLIGCADGSLILEKENRLGTQEPIKYRRQKPRNEESGTVLSPHCCRHTYVSQLQAQGVPLETIQSLTGHADVDMTEHYLHVQKEVKEDAAQKLNSLFKKGKPTLHIA